MKKILIASCLLVTLVAALCLPACKATRTISSTATYTEVTDSSKVTTTISTKTVEDYLGIQKK
ncbi:MAG: hypothetical protein IJT12_09125 [Paludibacteraceae bacterium]|nr:hypothetical protein [Paludibacteraceae bacterium]